MRNITLLLALCMSIGLSGVAWAETIAVQCNLKFESLMVYEGKWFSKDKDNDLSFTITIDTSTNKAYLTGNHGSIELLMIGGSGQISFLQVSGNEPVLYTTLTTVVLVADDEKRFPTVHSRHNGSPSKTGAQ